MNDVLSQYARKLQSKSSAFKAMRLRLHNRSAANRLTFFDTENEAKKLSEKNKHNYKTKLAPNRTADCVFLSRNSINPFAVLSGLCRATKTPVCVTNKHCRNSSAFLLSIKNNFVKQKAPALSRRRFALCCNYPNYHKQP